MSSERENARDVTRGEFEEVEKMVRDIRNLVILLVVIMSPDLFHRVAALVTH